jgi:medium-chain acyl-[acyl-carrier-protein] hydrolase
LKAAPLAPKFVRQAASAQPRVRLFCLPFAGGSAAVFAGWGERLKPDIEVWAAQPRARGMRYKEPSLETVEAMADEYFAALRPSLDMPFAFYGHSLGGLLGFELTRRLQAEGLALPEHLFIGASGPPHMGRIYEEIGHLPDAEFILAIQERYAGIPEAVLREPELMAMFLPPLKGDFVAYERYQFRRTVQVACPVTVFAGAEDRVLAPHLLEEWERHVAGAFSMETVPGGHFFLTESAERVQRRIRKSLEEGSVSAHSAAVSQRA